MDSNGENKQLIVKDTDPKECVSTRIKVLLFALIYNCALTVTTTIEPQFTYSYIKQHFVHNDTKNQIFNNASSRIQSCTKNSSSSDESIQQLASDWSWYTQMAEAGVSFPVVVFAGALADRFGRKPVLMWNLIISTLSFVLKTVIVYKNYNLYFYTLACGILGLAGSFYTYQITNFAILADVTDEGKDRSFIMTAFDALSAIGSVSFQIGTGYLVQYLGFRDPYIIAAGMFVVLTILVQVTLTDPWQQPKIKPELKCLKIPVQQFSFCFEKENMNKNSKVGYFIMYMVAYCFFYFPHCTVSGIRTLLQLGTPFCWTAENIGWYGAASDFTMFVGGTLILKLLHLCCGNISDGAISLLGNISCLSTYVMYGLSDNKYILYGGKYQLILRSKLFEIVFLKTTILV